MYEFERERVVIFSRITCNYIGEIESMGKHMGWRHVDERQMILSIDGGNRGVKERR